VWSSEVAWSLSGNGGWRYSAHADAGVPLRMAERWLAAYTTDGSTARSGRTDRTRRRRIPVELVELIEGMALRRPPPKVVQVHREAARIAAERGWSAPSYPVVYRIIADLDRGLVSLAHRGDAGYRNDFDLAWIHRRGSGPERVVTARVPLALEEWGFSRT